MKLSKLFRDNGPDMKPVETECMDEKRMMEIALNDSDYRIRLKAVSRISDDDFLRAIAFDDSNVMVQIACVDNIDNENHLSDIARMHSNCHARIAAIAKIDDRSILEDLSVNETNKKVKEFILSKLNLESCPKMLFNFQCFSLKNSYISPLINFQLYFECFRQNNVVKD